jgi:hypothetical protein
VPGPATPRSWSYLHGLAAINANDVWAVGEQNDNFGSVSETLVEHWDGSSWSVVASPNVGTQGSWLSSASAISANDIWAVGASGNGSAGQSLTLHWNGTVWSVVSSPAQGAYSLLNGVDALSSQDVWAVGEYDNGVARATLSMHWNGSVWSIVPTPGGTGSNLRGVTALAANDVWAVGYSSNGTDNTLVLHWDGSVWNVVPSPNVGSGGNYLLGVAAVSPTDIWAVGRTGRTQTLVEHWDGEYWAVIAAPPVVSQRTELHSISVLSANDIWAAGTYDYSSLHDQALALHWDGLAWSLSSTSNPGYSNVVEGVAAISANNVWLAGHGRSASSNDRTLLQHYVSPCVTPTPSPTSTPIPVLTLTPTISFPSTATPTVAVPTATSTATFTRTAIPTPTIMPTGTSTPVVPPSNTATSTVTTPTACTLQFTDVPLTNTFYTFVRCLACGGIISGYACGSDGEPCDGENNPYFRPYNNITRGQIAKIVSNAAGYNENPDPQIYEDADSTNPFYQWINRLSRRGHMGGYPCGTVPEEPCNPPDDRPYFRPFNNATRAQLAKIVSNAAGLVDTGAGQIFADVPPDNGFYVWIQRLASRGIMGGYPCGGDGEPCDDQDRPYFRPYNSVTRGQTSKIVAGAFFPNCGTP